MKQLYLWYYYYYYYYYGSTEEARGSSEVCQPNMPYYAKMGVCPMKNSGMTFTFRWNLELLFHYLSKTLHTQFRWLSMVKGWCIAPA